MASMVNEETEYQTSEHAEEEEEEVERDQQDEKLEDANSHIEGKLITWKHKKLKKWKMEMLRLVMTSQRQIPSQRMIKTTATRKNSLDSMRTKLK